MNCEFENIEITENEKLWLKECYRCFQDFEEPNIRVIKAKLYDDIPTDFKPMEISSRLLASGRYITPMGIELLDPDNEYISSLDQVMKGLLAYLKENPNQFQINSDEISTFTKLDNKVVRWLLIYLYKIFGLYNNYKGSLETDDLIINISQDTFDKVWSFDNFCKFTKDHFRNKERSNRLNYSNHLYQIPNFEDNFHPIFKSRVTRVDQKLAFIIMPFEESWSNRVYERLIKKYIEPLGIQCLRADNLHGQIVIDDIWVKINQSAFVIADVTGKNPNVMYELGIVHSVGKPCILITQELDEIPFDTNYLRHYPYEDVEGGFDDLGKQFKEILTAIYDENYGGIDFSE